MINACFLVLLAELCKCMYAQFPLSFSLKNFKTKFVFLDQYLTQKPDSKS